ncbi:MAG: SCO family protein [Burkholderiaceae bacterium]
MSGLALLVVIYFSLGGPVQPAPRLVDGFSSLKAFPYEPPEPGSYQLPALKTVPTGSLLNHESVPVELDKLLRGRYSLVSFVYLNCSDAQGCPLAMSTLWQLHSDSKKFPTLRNDLQLATISFDPRRDTPASLNMIVESMAQDRERKKKLDWHFLTGTSVEAIKPLLAGFGQAVGRNGDSVTINHLLRMFLVDRQGQIRNVYGLGSIDPRLIITDVQTLLIQEAQGRQQ